MPFCPKCGEAASGAFCTKCGTAIPQSAPPALPVKVSLGQLEIIALVGAGLGFIGSLIPTPHTTRVLGVAVATSPASLVTGSPGLGALALLCAIGAGVLVLLSTQPWYPLAQSAVGGGMFLFGLIGMLTSGAWLGGLLFLIGTGLVLFAGLSRLARQPSPPPKG
jgi:hypothetical protein